MNPDDPLEQLKALKQQQAGGSGTSGGDPLEQLKAMKAQGTPKPASDGAEEGVLDHALEMATFGLHKKVVGAGQAIGDVLQHGLDAHPIDTYNQSLQSTEGREQAAAQQHPWLNSAAGATGFFGTLAADAPFQAVNAARNGVSLLPEAVDYAEGAPGVGAALKRIGQSAKTAGVTGATVAGVSSTGTPLQRLAQYVGGGVTGTLLGGTAQTAGEAGGGLRSLLQHFSTPNADLGELAANQRIVGKLGQDQLDPSDLLRNAQQSRTLGAPAVVAHLGGPSLDNTTWLATTGTSPEASTLKQSLVNAQRGEGGVLNRGLTAMSGIENTPANQADTFLQHLENVRQAAGARDYPIAYDQPPVTNPNVLDAIRRDPDLRASLNQGVNIMQREADLARLRSGGQGTTVANPLNAAPVQEGPTLTPTGEGLVRAGVPRDRVIAQGYVQEPADLPELPIQMLDYMKQGVGPVVDRGIAKGQLSSHDAGIINQKVQTILGQINNPAYDAARANQAALFGQIEAGQAGQRAFSQAPEVIGQQLADLTPAQQTAYRTTQTSSLRDLLNDKKYGADLSTGLFDTPTMHAQLRASYSRPDQLGPATPDRELDPYLAQGRILNRVNQAATGNSKTAERQATQGETVDNTAVDAAHLLTSPRRAIYNIPGKIKDAKDREVKQIMLQALARKLNISADSPELPGLVDQLYGAMQAPTGRDVTATFPRRQAVAQGAGILSGLLSGGQFSGSQQ